MIDVGISFAKLVGVNCTMLSNPEKAKMANPAPMTFLLGICPTLQHQKPQLQTRRMVVG